MNDTQMLIDPSDAELDFEDDVEFEELEESEFDAEMAALATRVRAARYAGA